MIFLPERLQISSINSDKSKIILKRVIQANLVGSYCTEFCKSIRTSFFTEDINTRDLLYRFIDTKNFICQFNCFEVFDNL